MRKPSDLKASLDAMPQAPLDALIAFADTVTVEARHAIVAFAATRRLPAIYEASEWVAAGGLMAHGVRHVDQFRQSAPCVDRILKGARPADLPASPPTIVRLTIDSTVACAPGNAIPASLLLRADELVR